MFNQFEFNKSGLRRILGPLELSIMEVIWTAGQSVSIREVCDALAHTDTPPAFTTVMTVMNRLATKKLLERTGSRKNYLFRAALGKQELEDRVSQSVIQEILADYGPMAITHFVDAVASDPTKRSILESLLEKKENDDRGGGPK